MEDYIIRPLRQDDLEAVFELLSAFPDPYPAGYVQNDKRGGIKWLLNYILEKSDNSEGQSFILEISGEIVGHIAYVRKEREQDKYEVWAVAISRPHQRRGLGRKLFEYTEQELKKVKARSKHDRLIMMWQCGKTESKIYEKFGGKLWYICPGWWSHKKKGIDRYVMYKTV